jgi:DNA-binding LacI/PurR family transcriptional regulator
VSRVLADKDQVSDEMRERVLASVAKLGYRPNRIARSLRVQTSSAIGLLVVDVQNPFFAAVARAIEDAAMERGYMTLLCNTGGDVEQEELYLDLLDAEQVAGVIITPRLEICPSCQQLVDQGIPLVACDTRLEQPEVDAVVVNNSEVSYQLVERFILDGHRRIGAVVGETNTMTARERLEGYFQALTHHGLPADGDLVRQTIGQNGYQLTGELLNLPNPPTALFCGYNSVTIGALKAIRERALRVPEEIALGGFFDEMNYLETEWLSWIEPDLYLVTQPIKRLGCTAAELLFARIEGDNRPPQEVVLTCNTVGF